ncbi:LysR substrate-binding domain-containing protein [Saccharopolyspora hordei]|uniref:DNA-binding transcriptional LysR family regulator n=1 Tax=Saccharopolyspora hordei TaxID=1838 RepID=A0A853AV13_9PSEU|nr:LysR substrate-binding domain-containing protein [Saccharopolyspora hordei]NYI86523.1 DNA-binding transcriptional LysR family regulator [Saccharopolyspora hordei]
MVDQSQPVDDPSQLAAHLAPTLAVLRAVAAEGHVTRAAEVLGVPQPTVSRTLAKLGARLGAPVTARQGRGILLTRAGTLLARAAEDAMQRLEAGCRAVVEELDPDRGRVTFGFQHTMGSTLVPPLLRGFRDQHPQVRFELVQGSRDTMLARTWAGEVDLCLVAPLPVGDPRWECATVQEEPLVAVLHVHHRLARRAALRLADLAAEDFVAMRPGYGMRQIFMRLAESAGFEPRLAYESEEVDTVRGLVAAGLGVAVLPPAGTAPAPDTVEIPLTPPAYRTIGLAWPANRPQPPAVRTFRDHALTTRSG